MILIWYNNGEVMKVPISKKNTKALIIMPKELKETLIEESKEQRRSLSNYVVTILEGRKGKK